MKYFISLITILLLFISCQQKNVEIESTPHLGRYIYRDDNDIHHIDPNCIKLRRGKDDSGHDIYAKHMMDTAEFTIVEPECFRACSRCVSDKDYEDMLRISNRNMQHKAKQWLYDKLLQSNYDMPDYSTYCMRLDDIEVRHRLYLIAQEEDWNVGESEEEFSNLLGYFQ